MKESVGAIHSEEGKLGESVEAAIYSAFFL